MTLAKARLIPKDPGIKGIEFMFNPTELTFERVVKTSVNEGARSKKEGQGKLSFSNTNPYKVTINKILFDTYETGENVVEKHIELFRRAVQFDDKLVEDKKERPPLYIFTWGKNEYLKACFVEKLNYKLTMFLPDGRPVRAIIDNLTLVQADSLVANLPMSTPAIDQALRQEDSMQNRQNSRPTSNNAASRDRSQNRPGRR